MFDVPTKALVDVPDTAVYVNEFPTEVMWMPDARLYILRSETGTGTFQPRAELWRFQPEQNTIVMEESVLLSNQNLGAAGGQHLEDGRAQGAGAGEARAAFARGAGNLEDVRRPKAQRHV